MITENSALRLFDLRGKVAVVLGGSGAIGGALAFGLAQAGASVAVTYGAHRENADAVVARITDAPAFVGQARSYRVDANSTASFARNADEVASDYGRLDILVNCAGGNVAAAITGPAKTFFDLEMAPLSEVMQLNFYGGCLWPCYYYGRKLAAQEEGGSIINITSMNYYRPLEGRPGYAAAKAAVGNFTQWLACHMAKECNPKVRVNAIAPGFVPNQRMIRTLLNEDGSYAPRGQKIIDHTPMGRLSTPDDLVGTCIWYASEASAYITGTITPIDGGFTAYAGL